MSDQDLLEKTRRGAVSHAMAALPRRSKIFAAGAAVVLAAGGLYYWHGRSGGTEAAPVLVTAERGDVEAVVSAVGNLQPLSTVDVGAQVTGQLKTLFVHIGDEVKKGQPLAEIDSAVAAARVDADNAQLQNLQAQLADRQSTLALATSEGTRQNNLKAAGATSQSVFDNAQAALRSARAQVNAVSAQIMQQRSSSLKADQATLGYARIYAPKDGTVTAIPAKEGQTLNASQSAPVILTISDLDTMTVNTQVSEADVPKLHLGMPVYFTTLGDRRRRYPATLRQLLPTPTTVNNVVLYTALFDVANPAHSLLPQMTAQVFFVLAAAHDVVTLPVSAIKFGDDADGSAKRLPAVRRQAVVTLLLPSGQREERKVVVGVSNRISAEIVSACRPAMSRSPPGRRVNQIDFRAGRLAEPMLELDGVGKTYRIGNEVTVEALRGVTLSIWPGEFVAIMGPSGSGKSTLMNILGCLDRPSAGSYRVFGRDVAEMDSDGLAALRRDAFGFIFQGYNLLPTVTAEENVEIPAIYAGLKTAARKQRADALLARLGMGDRRHHKPNQLSGGQQQRVCIARALMNGGQIILADEPTGALDSKSGADVMALLKGFAAEGHTVILITHDTKVAAYADRVIEIADGVITKDDGTRALAASPLTPALSPKGGEGGMGAGVLAGDSVQMAVRALRANIFRTVLTLLGIVIGVASVVTMLAIGEGSRQQMVAQIGQMGTNLLIVRPQFRNARGYNGAIASLNEQDAQEIAKLPFVNSALPLSNSNATVRAGNIDYQTQITSTTAALPRTRSWPVADGIFFDASDQASFATVAVLGQTVKGVLFPGNEDPIGQYVLINNVPFQVIGVMTAKGASANGNDSDDVIFVPLSTGMLRVSGENFVRSITVAVSDLSKMAFVQDAVTRLITARHNGAEDFQIRNLADVIQAASAEQDTMTLLLGSVAAISLLVGGIGIMNIMLVSVVERTREIGIRMATGARQRDVLRQFLAEAILVSGLGGVAGVIAGVAAAYVVRGFGTPTAFTPGPMLLAFGCATVTGLVFGYAPARKAARLDPVVALASD